MRPLGEFSGDTTVRVPRGRRLIAVFVAAILVAAGIVFVGPGASAPARAATTLAVNSTLFLGSDVTPGDGICATSTGVCTLRAAFEEANALGGNATITVASGFSGTISANNCTPSTWMYTTTLGYTTGAYYAITAPNVTVDLKNSLAVAPSTDCNSTALYVNGASAVIQNVTNVIGGDVAYHVGSGGAGSSFVNVTTVQTANNYLERTIMLLTGANNVTVSSSTFSGNMGAGAVDEGVIEIYPSATVTNLRIIGNTFTNDTTSGAACSASDGRACRRSAIASGTNTTLATLVVQGNSFLNYSATNTTPVHFYPQTGIKLSAFDFNGNTITTSLTGVALAYGSAMVSLPADQAITGVNTIRNNRITSTTGVSAGYAIYYDSIYTTAGNTTASNLSITDNYIDGFGYNVSGLHGGSVELYQTGITTVQRNLFGIRTNASTTATSETSANTFVNNYSTATNRDITTWYPTVATVNNTACTMALTLTQGAAPTATAPVTVDVYYSTAGGSELYLGNFAVSASPATVTVPYSTSAAGYLRVQTQGAAPAVGSQVESSQYSRRLAVAASTCGPRLTVNQAGGQADPTSQRSIAFTVTSTAVLTASGAGSLQASSFTTSASTAAGVQVVSVTKITEYLYSVIARANDSGTVVLSLAAGAVTNSGGVASVASTSTDNSVTYVNPLSLAPTALTVYQGTPSVPYTVTRLAALPATADIVIASTVSNAYATAPSSSTIGTSATTVTVPVTSGVLGGVSRTATITQTVTSTDPNYNGLLLPAVTVTASPPATLSPNTGPIGGGQSVAVTVAYLPAAVTGISFGANAATFTGTGSALTASTPAITSPTGVNVTVDVTITYANGTSVVLPGAYTYVPQPAMTVVKAAFSDAAHTVPIASGAGVTTGQTVYWTYTVQNTGQTPISSLTVTDPKLPAATYPSGVVCTVASLAIGATTVCSASAAVTP